MSRSVRRPLHQPLPTSNVSRCYPSVMTAGGHPAGARPRSRGSPTMGHYKSNLRDLEFTLCEVLGRGDVMGTGPFAEMDADTARSVLDEVARLAEGPLAESFADADRNPPVFDPATHTVTMPESFKRSFRTLMDAEWFRLELPI